MRLTQTIGAHGMQAVRSIIELGMQPTREGLPSSSKPTGSPTERKRQQQDELGVRPIQRGSSAIIGCVEQGNSERLALSHQTNGQV